MTWIGAALALAAAGAAYAVGWRHSRRVCGCRRGKPTAAQLREALANLVWAVGPPPPPPAFPAPEPRVRVDSDPDIGLEGVYVDPPLEVVTASVLCPACGGTHRVRNPRRAVCPVTGRELSFPTE